MTIVGKTGRRCDMLLLDYCVSLLPDSKIDEENHQKTDTIVFGKRCVEAYRSDAVLYLLIPILYYLTLYFVHTY